MKSVNQIHLASSPIPIPYNNKRNYRCSANKTLKHCNCSPMQSPQRKSFTESKMKKQIASSAPVLIDFDKEADFVIDETCLSSDENDFYPQSCPLSNTIMNASSVHLVNGLNTDKDIMQVEEFFVLCESPKIKDVSNTLSYHILDSKKGILAFTNEQHIQVLKRYLQLPYFVVKIHRNDLIYYNKMTNTSSIVLYNSYTDIESKSSYFLYYGLNSE
jgi:hypothetical protein